MTKSDKAIRVLFIHSANYHPLGAGPWVHGLIMKYLDRRWVEIHAATADLSEDLIRPAPMKTLVSNIAEVRQVHIDFGPDKIKVQLRSSSWCRRLRAASRVANGILHFFHLLLYIKRHRINLIHTDERPRDALAAVLLGKLTRTPSIVHVHVAYGNWMKPALLWSMKKADQLFAVSEFVAQTLVAAGHPQSKTRVILNSIDVDSWQASKGRQAIRSEFGIEPDHPVIITVCRIGPGKGVLELVRCVANLIAEFPDLRLLIVGDHQSDDFRLDIENLIVTSGLSERVIFTGHRSDVPDLMAAADIYCMPSVEEPFGLVWLEAMAMSLPVVALTNGGTPEVVVDGATAFLSDTGDISTMTHHLRRLLLDPELRLTMGQEGRKRVEERFSGPRLARDVLSAYSALLDERDSARP